MRRYLPPAAAIVLVLGYLLVGTRIDVPVVRIAWLVVALGMFAGYVIYQQWLSRSYFAAVDASNDLMRRTVAQTDGLRVAVMDRMWPATNSFWNAVFTGYARSPFPDMHGRRVATYSKNWTGLDREDATVLLSNPNLDGHTIRLLSERAVDEVRNHPLLDRDGARVDWMLIAAVGVAVTVFPWEFSEQFKTEVRAMEFLGVLASSDRSRQRG